MYNTYNISIICIKKYNTVYIYYCASLYLLFKRQQRSETL